jgi:hypothetical protein
MVVVPTLCPCLHNLLVLSRGGHRDGKWNGKRAGWEEMGLGLLTATTIHALVAQVMGIEEEQSEEDSMIRLGQRSARWGSPMQDSLV